MKKIFALALVVFMLTAVLVSCGGGDSIIGKWKAEEDGVEMVYTFEKDGKATVSMMGIDVEATWEEKDGKLTMSMTMLGETETLFEGAEYKVDGDKLSITYEGETLELTKVEE